MIGGRQRRESTGYTNKREAEKLLALRKAQVLEDRLHLPRSHSPKIGNFAEQFLESTPYEKTRSRYRSSVNKILQHLGPTIKLSDISSSVIFAFQQRRLADGAGKATVNRDIATLSSMLSLAKRLRLISQNPCRDVGKLNERRDRRQAKPFSYEEEMRIRQFSPIWLRVLITLLVETGLRVKKEALPLKWADVLLESQPSCIHVRNSKSAAGIRTVWLTNHCRETLIRWHETCKQIHSEFVFPSPRNSAGHMVDYKRAWTNAAKTAGLTDRRIYDFRATFATRANASHAPALTLAHLLGHVSTSLLPTYVKPLDANTKAVIDALDFARTAWTPQLGSIH